MHSVYQSTGGWAELGLVEDARQQLAVLNRDHAFLGVRTPSCPRDLTLPIHPKVTRARRPNVLEDGADDLLARPPHHRLDDGRRNHLDPLAVNMTALRPKG